MFIFNIVLLDAMPRPAAIKLRHALVNPRIFAPFTQHQQDCSTLLVAALDHHGKAAVVLGETNQGGDFQPRRQPGFFAHSGGNRCALA